jgi:hypothetical protein
VRRELRQLLNDDWLVRIAAALLLGFLLVDVFQGLGTLVVGLIEAEPDFPFNGGEPTTFRVGDRTVRYGPLLQSVLGLAGAVVLLALIMRWRGRSRR